MITGIESLKEQLAGETKGYSAELLLKFVVERFAGKVALATSFGAEDQVLTDMLCRVSDRPSIFTLDTGRLPEQTYEVMQAKK